MDSSSWIHGYAANSNAGGGNSGFMCGYVASCNPSVVQCREEEEEHHELLISSQIQQHLNQISMHMNIDEVEPAVYGDIGSVVDDFFHSQHAAAGGCSFPSSSSTSSSFRSTSLSCSPEISSSTPAHVLAAPATGLQFPEVSSLAATLVVLPYDDKYALSFLDAPAVMAPGGMSTSASAFRRYEQHLGPQRRPKPACGQRMFKTAMSVLAKMHTAMRYNHQQQQQQQQFYYQQQQVSAAEPSANELQQQHMISERKRREKLKDSFHALKAVLPHGSKKLDKTSMLIVAREYVSSLKSKVNELEEKNQALQSQELARRATSAVEDDAGDKVEIQVTRAAAAEDHQNGEVFTVKIATPARGGNTTDVVLKTVQCLKDQIGGDVSLVSMSTSDGPHRASLTLHLKSESGAKWEEEAVRETLTKAVAIRSDDKSTTPTCRGGGRAGRPRRH